MDYLLDTNIVLHLIRETPLADKIISDYQLFEIPQREFISIVTEGELESIALQNQWGENKKNELTNYLNKFINVDIRFGKIVKRYAEIDAFSQGRLKNRPLNISARNMTKNDLWIAATASVLEIPLITTDKDFMHLHNEFLNLILIEAANAKN